MTFTNPELVSRLISPLMIGGIAGLTISVTVTNLVSKYIDEQIKEKLDELKLLAKKNEGAYLAFSAAARSESDKWREREEKLARYERYIFEFLTGSILFLMFPFLYSFNTPYLQFLGNEYLSLSIISLLIVSSYVYIVCAIFLLIYTYFDVKETKDMVRKYSLFPDFRDYKNFRGEQEPIPTGEHHITFFERISGFLLREAIRLKKIACRLCIYCYLFPEKFPEIFDDLFDP